MKLSEAIKTLEFIKAQYNYDLDVRLDVAPSDVHEGNITSHDNFFIVEEPDAENDNKMSIRLSAFPY